MGFEGGLKKVQAWFTENREDIVRSSKHADFSCSRIGLAKKESASTTSSHGKTISERA